MRNTAIAFLAGLLVALLGVAALDTSRQVLHMPAASTAPRPLPLARYDTDAAAITSGHPNFRATDYAVSADGKAVSGVWEADGPSTFRWSYSDDEAVYIHEGQVDVEYLGRRFSLKPGEMAYFRAGTHADWSVPQHVRKSWTIYTTGRATRWWRRLTGADTPA